MKLSARDISAFLQSPGKVAATLIYGPDEGQTRDMLQQIAAKVLPNPKDGMAITELTESKILADPALLSDELLAISLMGGPRLVVLRDAGDKSAKLVEDCLTRLPWSAYLVVMGGELSPRSSLRSLFERDARLAALPCYKEEGRALESSIQQMLSEYGLTAERDALHYLTQHLGNDKRITQSEIGKLALYMGEERRVQLEDAMACIQHNQDVGLDDVCYALGAGQAGPLLKHMERLLSEGVSPIAMLRAVTRHLQKLAQVHALMQRGQSLEQAVEGMRPPIFFKLLPSFKQQAARWNALSLHRALAHVAEAERASKRLSPSSEAICKHLFLDLAR